MNLAPGFQPWLLWLGIFSPHILSTLSLYPDQVVAELTVNLWENEIPWKHGVK